MIRAGADVQTLPDFTVQHRQAAPAEATSTQRQMTAEKEEEVPDAFRCPILFELMRDPVICVDGHTYERSAIEEWLRLNDRSPLTNKPLESLLLIPNHAMRSAIESYRANSSRREDYAAMVEDHGGIPRDDLDVAADRRVRAVEKRYLV